MNTQARFQPPWNEAEWRSETHTWIRTQVDRLGSKLTGDPESIHARPWSTVLRVPTDRGALFFKAGGPTQAFEPGLLGLLSERRPLETLPLLAADPERGWSLLPDGGQTLRQFAQGNVDLNAWKEILRQYAETQVAASEWAQEIQRCGVPIYRSEYLVNMYSEILRDNELSLVGEGEDLLTPAQHRKLMSNASVVKQLFDELNSYGIPLSIEHGDLHDANIFVQDGRYIVFDWGDASFTHPFFTLLIPIRHINDKLGVSEYADHPDLIALREAYLQPWEKFASKEKLLKAWSLAHHLAKFARTINWYRVVKLTVPELGREYQSSVSGWFQEFLAHPSDRLAD
jgi:hypothetical protein